MPWIALAAIALIVAGSLYPFDFNHGDVSIITAFHQLSWVKSGRTDHLLNILMYMPLGFALSLWIHRSLRRSWSIILACVAGALLSLGIETAQYYFDRVPSYLDVLLNTSGTLLGALAGFGWGAMINWIKLPENVSSQTGDRNALLLILLFIIWRMIDMSLHISLAHLKLALHPLLHIEISWLLVARYLLLWIIVSLAVLSYSSQQRGNEALLVVIAIVLLGRVLFVTPAFDSSELLALVLLFPALVAVHFLHWVPASSATFAALIGLYIHDHVWFSVGEFHFNFDFLPFVDWLRQGMPVNLQSLLHMLFVFAAMIWLLKVSLLSLRAAVTVIVLMLLGIEMLHLWQPGHSGSITRPLLALCTGLVMMVVDRKSNS